MKKIHPADMVLLTWALIFLVIGAAAILADRTGFKDPARIGTLLATSVGTWNVFARPLLNRTSRALFWTLPIFLLATDIYGIQSHPSSENHGLLWIAACWAFIGLA